MYSQAPANLGNSWSSGCSRDRRDRKLISGKREVPSVDGMKKRSRFRFRWKARREWTTIDKMKKTEINSYKGAGM